MSKKGNDNPERIAVWWAFWYVRRRVARRIKFLVWEGTSRLQKLRKKKKPSRTLLLPPNSSHKNCEKNATKITGNTFFAVFLSRCLLLSKVLTVCWIGRRDVVVLSRINTRLVLLSTGENPHRETHPSLGTTTLQNASTGSLKVRKRVGLSHWPRTCATALCLF
jgi:hypothetical protein